MLLGWLNSEPCFQRTLTEYWIDLRLKELDRIFAISVGGFSIMDNHLHFLLRIDVEQDGCTGAFFEGRYKSIAILDEEALLSVCAYIDLNPVGEGMREGLTLGQYLMLVDYTSRLVRDGKAAVRAEVESIFTRLGSSAESWGARMLKLSGTRLLGRFLSASRGRLREIAQRIGVRHLVNVG